jgi:hypothetical protein
MTAIGGGQAVPASNTASRGCARAPRTAASKVGNSGAPGGGPRRASGTPKASETAGIAKGKRATRATKSKAQEGSGAA